MTELAAPQISSLMEALPGIAAVLRSPVASAMASLVRAGAGLEEFSLNDAEELLRFGVRRNLLTQEEVDRLLDEAREVVARRPAKPGAADAGTKAPKAKSPPPLTAPLTVTSAPARQPTVDVPTKVAAPAPKPVAKAAKVAPPAPVKAAPKAAAQPPKAAVVTKAVAKGSAGKGPAAKPAAKPVHKAKSVAQSSKAAPKKTPAKAPAKAPAKKVPAKGAKKRR